MIFALEFMQILPISLPSPLDCGFRLVIKPWDWVNDLSPNIQPDIETEEETSEGPLFRVIIHNDDVTPMEFVINILVNIFLLDSLHALQVMYTAHYQGHAYVQTLPKPEAERRVGMAHISARLNKYPLQFTIEPE